MNNPNEIFPIDRRPKPPLSEAERAKLLEAELEEGLRGTFPASDPPSVLRHEDEALG